VTLRGTAKANEKKLAITMIAKKVAGNCVVDNQLEINPRS